MLDPTPEEELLLKAGEPFVTEWSSYEDICGTIRQDARKFAGVSGNHFRLEDVDPAAVEVIKTAIPFPETICSAFDELRAWDKLDRDRAHFYSHHEYYYDVRIELRIDLLRGIMRNQPVTSWDDLEARFHYKSYEWQQQWIDERSFDDPEWARLFADCRILRARVGLNHKALSKLDASPMQTSALPFCPCWTLTLNCQIERYPAASV